MSHQTSAGTNTSPREDSIFHGITVTPNADDMPNWVVRQKIVDFINMQPRRGTLPAISGPVGSGKTMVALQWMHKTGGSFQYISGRPPVDIPKSWISEADAFGKQFSRFLNSTSKEPHELDAEEIEENMIQLVEMSQSGSSQFVVDDLEMIRRTGLNLMQPFFGKHFSRINFKSALIVSRILDSYTLSNLQAIGLVRVVLPHRLAFDESETEKARQIGLFGDASEAEIADARESEGGWITGMLASLDGHGGKTIDYDTLENRILSDLLLRQPKSVLHIMVAACWLPLNDVSLWEKLFDRFELPHWMIPATISQIPHRYLNRKGTKFEISPSVVEIVQKHTDLTTDPDWIRSLFQIASKWYVENSYISHAQALAREIGDTSHLLSQIREACRPLAEDENWQAIAIALEGISHKEILQDPDLSFWYYLGLSQRNQWSELRTWNELLLDTWSTSEDPITKARYHLVRSWNAATFQRSDEAFEHAQLSYYAYGATVSVERMWASGAASVAQGSLGNAASSREWSALTNFDQSLYATPSKFGNAVYIPERYSWLAVRGLMRQALSIVERHIRSLEDHGPMAIRFHELAAQIHIEQGNFDSARDHIEKIREYAEDSINGLHYLRMAESKLLWAQGDAASAFAMLDSEHSTLDLRIDRMARETYQRAYYAASFGDLSSAELYLSVAPMGETPNIRFFGDAHPELVKAKILWKFGDYEQALTLANSVSARAESANHLQIAIAAKACIAHFHHQLNDTELRDLAINQAIALNGDSGFQASFRFAGQDIRELAQPEEPVVDTALPTTVHNRGLTEREIQILQLVHQGQSNKEIAEQVYISLSTVKNHLSSAFDKLNSRNRREAVQQAIKLGIIREKK